MTFEEFVAITPSISSAETLLARIVWDMAITEAAQACDRRADRAGTIGRRFEADDCAEAVRSLKAKSPGTEGIDS